MTPVKDTVLLEEMTWPEVEAAIARGVRTVVVVVMTPPPNSTALTFPWPRTPLSDRPWVSGWRGGWARF